MPSHFCHKCGAPWESEKRQPGFKEVCEKCSAYLHCCKNCRFHVPTAPNQCYIPNTDHVADRKGLNFCEEFDFREGPPTGRAEAREKAAREGFATLFGEDAAEESKPSFDDLFNPKKSS